MSESASVKVVRTKGRPRIENPLSGSARNALYEQRRLAAGYRKVPFWIDNNTLEIFESLRDQSGFSSRENSEFLAAIMLKLVGKQWFGNDFTLPALNLLRPIPVTPKSPRPPLR